jgi:hypothetical protein
MRTQIIDFFAGRGNPVSATISMLLFTAGAGAINFLRGIKILKMVVEVSQRLPLKHAPD